jgi:acetyl esterase/lipase
MIHENVTIQGAQLTLYARDNSKEMDPNRVYPTVLICPGGAYGFCSDREAEPVALALLAEGFTCAVLRYSVNGANRPPAKHPTQLHEAAAAVVYLRENAARYHVDPARVFVCGFSAGGHVAGMLGTLWRETPEGEAARPTGMILSYAVLSSGEYAHHGSFYSICGDDQQLQARLSLENRVSADTAPAFLWHTADDDGVPAMNSLLMAQALARQNIPYELHIFRQGVHGLALANEQTLNPNWPACVNPDAAQWLQLAARWMKSFAQDSDS